MRGPSGHGREANIGALVRARRRALGLTQAAVARRSGVSESALSRWECGLNGEIGLLSAASVAAQLGLSLDELTGLASADNSLVAYCDRRGAGLALGVSW
jgi:transcriptional regulator with XRE-family HTH domain